MNNYLIPANSKKSQLILSLFNGVDLIIFGTGIVVTMSLLFVIKSSNIWVMIGILAPALITGFLVLPIPNYHNIRTFIKNIYLFYTSRRQYVWKGWCAKDEG